MEFSAYSEYKHSGVEWLGEVPSHWNDYSYQHLFKKKEIINQTQEQLLSVYLDRGVIPYSEGGGLVHKPADSLEKYQLVDVDDFVMNNQQAWRGSVGISAYRGIVSPAYLIFSINKDLASSKFLKYLLKDKSIVDQFMLASLSVGTIQRQIKWHLLKNLHINLPPINEQNQIARFLDKETAKIDGLIAKQEQLIVLLEEQRKSVISYAVTKGLNPNAPMKDSGVEWLGEVPEHWNIRKVFSLCEQIGSGTTPSATNNDYYENGTINFLQTGDLTDGYVNLTKKKITEKALNEFSALKIYPKDSLVIAMYGATIGKIGILNIETTVNQACCVLNLSSQIDLNFAYYLFLSAKSFLISLSQGGTQPNINQDSIKSLRVTLPSKSEQRQIVEFLKKETLLIHNLIQKQQELITQLKEYRSSVISHAVTGKIDVRGLV